MTLPQRKGKLGYIFPAGGEVILSLYSVIVRLEYYGQFCTSPSTWETWAYWRVQQRATKMIKGLEHVIYGERLKEMGQFSFNHKIFHIETWGFIKKKKVHIWHCEKSVNIIYLMNNASTVMRQSKVRKKIEDHLLKWAVIIWYLRSQFQDVMH